MIPNTLKATVEPCKNMFGKRNGRFVAKLGEWSIEATTKDEALFMLDEAIQALQRYEHTTRYLCCHDGTMFVLRHHFGGWGYDIVHPKVGTVSGSSCIMGEGFNEAYASMKRHWEQMNEQQQPATTN